MFVKLQQQYGKAIGLYHDDGLGIFQESPRETENIKKNICKLFPENGLKITAEANKKVINFLDTTLGVNTGQHKPYTKPNNTLRYVNIKSNHPPVTLRSIPEGINKCLSELSSSKEIFDAAAPEYQKALDDSGYT